jgi:hypothetical protein
MKQERDLINEILLRASERGHRLFRNNSGVARYPDGSAVKYGVASPGGSDLIGWTQVTITPEMVGKTLAVFTAPEVKAGTTKTTKEQKSFLSVVSSSGGISGIVRSQNDMELMLNDYLHKMRS